MSSKYFTVKVAEGVHIVGFPSMMTKEASEAFKQESQAWLLSPVSTHVFDLAVLIAIDPTAIACVLNFSKQARKAGRALKSINLTSRVLEEIKVKGLVDAFGVQFPSATPAGKMDVRLINPFLSSVLEVFKTQVSTELVPGKPGLRGTVPHIDYGIVGIVSLNCQSFHGSIALCFPTPVFLKVYERMLGEAHKEITAETEDAVAELLNIVYGGAKVRLNKQHGFDFQPAIPTVLRGDRITIRQQTKNPVIVLPFESDIGSVHVELAADPPAEEKKRSA